MALRGGTIALLIQEDPMVLISIPIVVVVVVVVAVAVARFSALLGNDPLDYDDVQGLARAQAGGAERG